MFCPNSVPLNLLCFWTRSSSVDVGFPCVVPNDCVLYCMSSDPLWLLFSLPWSRLCPNSKHWFTTSFLQPLPWLITSCRSWKTSAFRWCSNSSKFVTESQIRLGVSFITDLVAYASANETLIVSSLGQTLLYFHSERTRLVCTRVLGRNAASTVLLVPRPFGGRWPRRWTAARKWTVPLQWRNQFWQSLEECTGKRCSDECAV